MFIFFILNKKQAFFDIYCRLHAVLTSIAFYISLNKSIEFNKFSFF